VLIDWTDEFQLHLDRLERQAENGDANALEVLELINVQLELLGALEEAPTQDTKSIAKVRQSHKHQVWRVSHPYHPNHAVRTIAWFPDSQHAVIALFANDKGKMGDIFYDSVGSRADQAIEKFIRQNSREDS